MSIFDKNEGNLSIAELENRVPQVPIRRTARRAAPRPRQDLRAGLISNQSILSKSSFFFSWKYKKFPSLIELVVKSILNNYG